MTPLEHDLHIRLAHVETQLAKQKRRFALVLIGIVTLSAAWSCKGKTNPKTDKISVVRDGAGAELGPGYITLRSGNQELLLSPHQIRFRITGEKTEQYTILGKDSLRFASAGGAQMNLTASSLQFGRKESQASIGVEKSGATVRGRAASSQRSFALTASNGQDSEQVQMFSTLPQRAVCEAIRHCTKLE